MNLYEYILKDICDLTKASESTLRPNERMCQLFEILTEIRNLFKSQLRNRNLNFFLSCDFDLEINLYVDEDRLKQVLLNLIFNAIKHTQKGFIKLHITKEQVEGKEYIVFKIQDSGVGIPEAKLKSLQKILHMKNYFSLRKAKHFLGLGL